MSNFAAPAFQLSVDSNYLVQQLQERLSEIHGPISIRHEASGKHLTLACPLCLQAYGRREFNSKHLQINVDKYFGLGQHSQRFLTLQTVKKKGYAQCMKEHGPFSMDQILGWPTLQERGIDNVEPRIIDQGDGSRYLIPDIRGYMIPDHPGKVIPLTSLPKSHPATLYLETRDYDPVLLHSQFRAAWCVEEAPEGEQYRRFYRKHGHGWKSTPQGRIIFYSDVSGIQACWQARFLELDLAGDRYVWHPYRESWETRPAWSKGQEPIKYYTAPGARRNSQLCGYDAVMSSMASKEPADRIVVLTEGPLDAARFPDRGLAVLGKNLSYAQAMLLTVACQGVILAFDADKYGAEACVKASALLSEVGLRTVNFFTKEEQESEGKMDVGELGYVACAERLKTLLLKFI